MKLSNIKKIMVANRAEIALRVLKSAKNLGIKTVAVYSTADRNSPHVAFADEAVLLGPPPSSQSYLNGDLIIEKALELNVDAIHPGYGFLSENADFAKKVLDAGLIFIGPPEHAIILMGSKLTSKKTVSQYDIPLIQGTDSALTDVKKGKNLAKKIGFPILIKASAGGGGKGMRIVKNIEEFESQMDRAVSEATNSFGDGSVFIEKFIQNPKHIEIQILADNYGKIVHLNERDCSVQRRHQKVVEEAPSTVLNKALRDKMGQAAIRVAQSCDYRGAGTVEFLLDDAGNFYFLEMNTRLQVEHPITECITGVDLVEQQIRIARGEPLTIHQDDVKINGHAIELRVYAENPLENFTPSIGHLNTYNIPSGEGIRVDNGFEQGMDIPVYYDSMLAKLVAHGTTREEAIERLKTAILQYEIEGIHTTLPFGTYVLSHPSFIEGNYTTKFVEKHFKPEDIRHSEHRHTKPIALVALKHYLGELQKVKLIKS